MALVMVFSMLPVSAFAADAEENAEVIEELEEIPEEELIDPWDDSLLPEEPMEPEPDEEPEESTPAPEEPEESAPVPEEPEETAPVPEEPEETDPETPAESEPTEPEMIEEDGETPLAASSGTCGTNLKWTLDTNGVLTISGTGNMSNYSYGNAPWYSVRTPVKSVVIEEGVTSIGNYAFYGCHNFTSITIPEGVSSIGRCAFYVCSGLASITIPDSVTSIGEWAFRGCSSLTSITIPDSVTSIGDSAFYYCSSLTSITIPDSVTSIGDWAFWACTSLTSIQVSDENSCYSSIDGVLYSKDGERLIVVPGEKTGSFCIPEGVTSIGDSAFCFCSNLTSISIPGSVTSIGEYAFEACSSLTSITIPDSVTSIGGGAFSECTVLTSITIPDSVTSIGEGAFWACTSLTSITIPESVTSIGNSAFSECSSLTSITIPDSVTSIGSYAFDECSSLTSIDIPDSVTSIGDSAFCGCSSLTSITIPEGVISIGECAFRFCENLTDINFLGDLPQIGSRAFEGITATAYYPTSNTTYANAGNYGGELTWKSHVHVYSTIVTIPTCTEEGCATHVCSVCGDEYVDQRIPANGHTYDLPWENDAHTHWQRCSVCGETTAPENHVPNSQTAIANGTKYCEVCGYRFILISITGPNTLCGGASGTFTAASLSPAVSGKDMIWGLRSSDTAFAAISNKGKLTTKAVCEPVEIFVIAYSKADSEVYTEYPVQLVPAAAAAKILCDDPAVDGVIAKDLSKGKTVQLSAAVEPASAMQSGKWKSSSTGVAVVDADGLVTFKKAGTVTITFTAGDGSKKSASVKITAGVPARDLAITGPDEVISGGKITLSASFSNTPTVKNVIWSSSDPAVAAVSNKGVVTAGKNVFEEKTVIITAKATDGSGEEASHEITVSPKPSVLTILDANGRNVTGQSISLNSNQKEFVLVAPDGSKWTSSKAKVASVADGKVTFLTTGTTVITAKSADGKASGSVTLTLSTLVNQITITPSEKLTLTAGKGKLALKATTNAGAAQKAVVWSSSDPAVASVNSKGEVSSKAALRAPEVVTITAAAKDGSGVSASVDVTVLPLSNAVYVNSMQSFKAVGMDIAPGETLNGRTIIVDIERVGTLRLAARVFPLSADQSVTWKSSSAKVAEVNSKGTVTIKGTGSVTITATANDGSKKTNTVKLNVVRYAKELRNLTPTNTVLAGKKLTLKIGLFTDSGAAPTSKALVFTLRPEDAAFASVNKSGALSAKKGTAGHTVIVTVTCKDDPSVTIQIPVEIQ